MRQEANNNGFTLIEVILTLVLLGILAVSAIPTMDISATVLDAASRKVLADIRYAQNLATTTGESYGFKTTGNATYQVYNVSTGDIVLSPLTSQAMNEDLSQSFKNTQFALTNYLIEFDAVGKPSQTSNLTVLLQYNEETKTITIQPNSGFIALQ